MVWQHESHFKVFRAAFGLILEIPGMKFSYEKLSKHKTQVYKAVMQSYRM